MNQRIWHQFYDTGVPTSVAFEDVSIPEALERTTAAYGDGVALIFMNRRMTYRQLKDHVDRFAAALSRLGVGKDTKVAIHLPNLPQTVIAYYATLSLGGQAVLTNPLYVEREIEEQWNDAGCQVAVVGDYLMEQRIRRIRDRLPVQHYVITTIPEYLRFPLSVLAPLKLKRARPPLMATVQWDDRMHSMRKLIADTAPDVPRVTVEPDDVAVLQYTGGTTGVSKGAMLTHRNLSYNVQQMVAWFPTVERGSEIWLSCLPFFHVFGMTVCMNFPVWVGATMVVMPNPRDIAGIIKNIAKHRVTAFPGVPAQFNAINNFPGVEKKDLSSVRVCVSGSAPLPVDVLERFEQATGGKIAEGFGMTETSPVTHCNPLQGLRKPGSIGVPLPDTDARVVSLSDGTSDVAPGAEGELIVRGPQVMKGYWNKPEATQDMIRGGWLYTGDLARLDEQGYAFIAGRKKDMILKGGYNVYPDEVDRVLMAHPAVLEAATIGVPSPGTGEMVKSFIVPAEGQTVTAEQLTEYCRGQLAAYKVPKEFEFRTELPKSAALKILRRQLREQELATRKAGGPEAT